MTPAASGVQAPLVEIVGVGKIFGSGPTSVPALRDVSLEIGRNAIFTLLGPSGCGKTTLLRMLAGFEHPDGGSIRIDGRDVAGDPPNRRPVNIVFQSYALFPHMSVTQNIAFGLERLDAQAVTMFDFIDLDEGRTPPDFTRWEPPRFAKS